VGVAPVAVVDAGADMALDVAVGTDTPVLAAAGVDRAIVVVRLAYV
jgi:hypothetical protein